MTSALWPCLFLALALSGATSVGGRGSRLGALMFQRTALSWPRDNVLVSPHGVAGVLGLLLPGADGNTRRQILRALHYPHDPYEMLGELHRSLTESSPGATVIIANGLFAQEGFAMKGPFLNTVRSAFRCESQNLDFTDAVGAASAINGWIGDHTHGKISNLVRPDMLDGPLTSLVAVNSIYFKGLWKTRFRPQDTKPGPFTGGDGRYHMVPMMSQVSLLNIGTATTPTGLSYAVIELPYEGDAISMLIALPPGGTPLSALLPHVGAAAVQGWAGLLNKANIHLSLPRFSIEAELDMKMPLLALGITDMFNRYRANFRHICSDPLYMSKALQRAKMEVNEDGTKASVATASVLLSRSSPLPVTVDRPFIFVVRHNHTGTILFMGQINKP